MSEARVRNCRWRDLLIYRLIFSEGVSTLGGDGTLCYLVARYSGESEGQIPIATLSISYYLILYVNFIQT